MQKLAACLRVQERAAMANLQLFRICPKYYFSLCAAAGETDCHVASLLAMTVGEVLAPVDTPCLLHTLRAPRPCTRAHVPAFSMSLRTSAHTGAAIRFPAGKLGNLALLRANSQLFRIRPKYCFSFCATAGVTDCHVASLLAMTCKNLPPVRTIPGHCRGAVGKRPCNRAHLPVFCMSLRTSAHTGAAIRFPAEKLCQSVILKANS